MDRRTGLLLALVAAGLLVHPLYLDLHAGERMLYPNFEPVDGESVPDDAAVIEYDELPPAAKTAFDREDHDPRTPDYGLWTDGRKPAIQVLQSQEYVERNGSHYRISFIHKDAAFPGLAALGSFLLYVLGLVLLVAAVYYSSGP